MLHTPRTRPAVLLACAIAAFYLLLTTRTTFWDRDEPRYAQVSVEMLRSGQFLYPTLFGDVYVEKPPLQYWLMALSMRVFGIGEFGARFWAPVAIGLTAFSTWVIGRRLYSPRIGWLAMLIVAGNPLVMISGVAATMDAVLMALITIAIAVFVCRLQSPAVVFPILFAAALAGALLVKGPVGLLPLLVVAGVLWARRRDPATRRISVETACAALAGLGLFAAWALPANAATTGRFLSQGVQRDILARIFSPNVGHGGNLLLWLPYYPAVLLIGFAPWSAFVPAALHELWRRDRERADARTLLNWWIAGPLVVFSLAVTRLPHYILPMWPALALAAASTVERTTSGIVDARARRWLRLGAPIAGVCAVVLCATVIGVSYAFGTRGMFVWLPLLIPAIVAAGIASFRLVRGDGHAWPLAVAAVIVLEAVGGLLWLPGAEAAKPVPIIAALIRSRMPRQAPIATLEFDEPSLRFYLGMTPTRIASSEQLQRWVDAAEPAVLVTTRAAMNRSGLSRLSLEELGSAAGFDVASVRQIELVALVRGARRP